MSKIVQDIKKINFLNSSIAFVTPDGKVIAVEKIPGFLLHVEYLRYIYKNNKEVKEILKDVDFKYYLENPSEVLTGIIPLFCKKGWSVFYNLAPNIYEPTNAAVIVLSEERSKAMDSSFIKLKEKFEPICFYSIGTYDSESSQILDLFSDGDYDFENPNSNKLYEVIEEKRLKNR